MLLQNIWDTTRKRLGLIEVLADYSGELKYFTEFNDANAPCNIITLGSFIIDYYLHC
jgi:hypothetical protein